MRYNLYACTTAGCWLTEGDVQAAIAPVHVMDSNAAAHVRRKLMNSPR
jgi:hypothetical protein